MRAREFIFNEGKKGKLDSEHLDSLPRGYRFPKMGNSYDIYRFGLSFAGSPDQNPDHTTEGPIGEVPMVFAYSEAEETIINHSKKLHKEKSKPINKGKSRENAAVHTTSPVASKKKNRYGV